MKAALGKGLEALIPEKGIEAINIDIKKIVPNSRQPRKNFRDSSLKELASSIKEKGVIQPVVVSKNHDGHYTLIAGERRLRAASMAGLAKIPAIVKKADERDSLEIALIENIQREDLNPIETAAAFEYLLKTYAMTQEELSDKVGKDRATIANYMRLLKLPEEVKGLLREEKITMGHARAILSIDAGRKQIEAARTIIEKGTSVRELEEVVRKGGKKKGVSKADTVDPHVKDVEERLRESLGTKVKVLQKGKKGRIEIEYYSLEELDRLLELLL